MRGSNICQGELCEHDSNIVMSIIHEDRIIAGYAIMGEFLNMLPGFWEREDYSVLYPAGTLWDL